MTTGTRATPALAVGACPDCEHGATAPGLLDRWFSDTRARLGFGNSRARCHYMESSVESGVGLPGECGCKHPFHGS